ncbi:hypothetical protein L2Y90_02170 [Burkholderia pyrrocinia]|uniref:hypothetical protein n=1 Tax=Burkholderia pyrrocinia TaxID=60550 RepID=UPI00215AEFF5|nr:hypothetical protein [Burkholderia pyrrocinia]UVE65955.1 hypothetical protein L2Y90_02170 [Burkholderia pyrrocinia]
MHIITAVLHGLMRSTSAGKQAVRMAASLVQPAVSQWRYPVPRLAQPSAPLEARSVLYSVA